MASFVAPLRPGFVGRLETFDDDLRLPFSNAILYNEADSDVAVCAAALLKVLDGDASSDDVADEPKKAEAARASVVAQQGVPAP